MHLGDTIIIIKVNIIIVSRIKQPNRTFRDETHPVMSTIFIPCYVNPKEATVIRAGGIRISRSGLDNVPDSLIIKMFTPHTIFWEPNDLNVSACILKSTNYI